MLELLRTLYDGQTEFKKEPDFYRQIMEDRQFERVCSQIYFFLKKQKRLDRLPPFFRNALKERFIRNISASLLLKAQLKQLLSRFESLGIDVIPLKGPLFAEKYYGDLAARDSGDIDILIRPEQMDAAITIIRAMEFVPGKKYEPYHFHRIFCKKMPDWPDELTIEVHWDLLRKKTSSLNAAELWHDSVPLRPYRHVFELSDFHTFYLICLHGWNHDLNSWKYFIDIIQLIHVMKDRLDYGQLLELAHRQLTWRRVSHTLMIVYHEFPHLDNVLPFPISHGTTLWWRRRDLQCADAPKKTVPTSIRRLKQLRDYDSLFQKWIFLKREMMPDPANFADIIGREAMARPRFVQYLLIYLKRFEGMFYRARR
ncbi:MULTISPECIES: nucleotidyltransferase family protein [unclassified Sporolactobacillus]|uniref:nucleotidyltransferase family protein n=1 Tax=unclassified Sporolactobacillus TaxID=2628533 RepID=UPI00236809C7|nr:nucleotidyltransferase family protein [Sporolactobacillus sp. CQH2019]MDD9148228.1 nucleotidyltransferase family protein [Sporolactobacillus sp. CQH2019]